MLSLRHSLLSLMMIPLCADGLNCRQSVQKTTISSLHIAIFEHKRIFPKNLTQRLPTMKKLMNTRLFSLSILCLGVFTMFSLTSCNETDDSSSKSEKEKTEKAAPAEKDKSGEHPSGDSEHPTGAEADTTDTKDEHPAGKKEHPSGGNEHPSGGDEHPK